MFKRVVVGLALLFTVGLVNIQAQADRTLTYGETVSGIFEQSAPGPHRWAFAIQDLEVFEVRLQRIGGQFAPTMTVLGPDGAPLSPDATSETTDYQEWRFTGIYKGGKYTVEVNGAAAPNNVINPSQYSLTLLYQGRHRANPDEGLTPLPVLGSAPPPDFRSAPAQANADLGLNVHDGRVTQPDARAERNRFVVTGANGRSIDINNANPISRSVTAIGFVGGYAGFATESVLFVTDQDITAFEVVQGIFEVTLGNGRTLRTDFYNVASVEIVGNLTAIRLPSGQRVLLDTATLDLTRRGGINGEGPNVEPVMEFALQNGDYIHTDAANWDTLAYLPLNGPHETRAVYGNDIRLMTAVNRLALFQRGFIAENDAANGVDTTYTDLTVELDDRDLTINTQPLGMGDIRVDATQVAVRPLHGRDITEPLANVGRLLVENGGVRVERLDGTYRLSLPDGTEIETPLPTDPIDTALPGQPGYTPRHFNNLGRTIFDLHPAYQITEALQPVNRVIGNFFYPVDEIIVPSHTLQLEWSRYYNSLSPATLVPAHLRNSPGTSLPGQLGDRWRHTYQLDLDISGAPLGTVRLVLPDGSQHLFRNTEAAPGRFRSASLLSWTIERTSGLTGAWRATTTEDLVYDFDRAGRLRRVANVEGQRLLFSPAPRESLAAVGAAGGFFVTEPYGRRLEVYSNPNGQIILVRDTQEREIRYEYTADGVNLAGVNYVDPDQTARYDYSTDGLISVRDSLSQYHPALDIVYSAPGRVASITENPNAADGAPARTFTYDYTSEQRVTLETTQVNGVVRERRWAYNPIYQLTAQDTPEPGWSFRYEYDQQSQQFAEFVQPDLSKLGIRANERGYITQLLDPRYRGSTQHDFTYAPLDDNRLVLTQISYPAVGGVRPTETFTYDDLGRLIERRRLVQQGQTPLERVTQYSYDPWGRLAEVVRLPLGDAPDVEPRVTTYSYDDFGYVSRMAEGSRTEVDTGQARVTLYQHDPVGRLLSVTNGRGTETAIIWDDERNLITQLRIAGEDAVVVNYQYDARGNLTQVEDRGATVDYQYNSLGQVISTQDARGEITEFERDEAGNILLVRLPDEDASTFRYTYDNLDRLRRITSPNGLETRYDYTIPEQGSVTFLDMTDPTGDRVNVQFDALGRVTVLQKVSRTGFTVYQYNIGYDTLGNVTEVQEAHVPGGRTLSMAYDLAGKPLAARVNQTTTTFTYDAFEYLATVTDPNGNTLAYTRDLFGNPLTVTRPDGAAETFTYDENDNLVAYVDALSRETRFNYDPLDRLIETVEAGAIRTSYTYDPRGNLISLIDPRGNELRAEYDELNRLTSTQDSAGGITTYEYDALGRLVETDIPGGRFQRYTYDREGNVVAVEQRENENVLYGYDGLGRVTSVTNLLGYSVLYNYNAINRLSTVIDPLGNADTYRWSSSGRMLEYQAPSGRGFEYTYDGLGRLTRVTDRAQGATNLLNVFLTYDAAGRVERVQFATDNDRDSARATAHSYAYDAVGNIIAYTPPGSDAAWALAYDAVGQLVAATDPLGNRTEYVYDDVGNTVEVREAANDPALTSTHRYAYDEAGNVTRYTAPDGLVTDYVYDERDLVVQVTEGVGTGAERVQRFIYDDAGNLARYVDAAERETVYIYDSFGRVTIIERNLPDAAGEPRRLRYTYTYDDIGNLTQIGFPAGTAINMTYNALNNRVRYVDAMSSVWAYTYDEQGNIRQVSDPLGSTTTYEYDSANRIRRVVYPVGSVVDVRYDIGPASQRQVEAPENLPGDLNSRERIVYELDAAGRLVRVQHNAREVYTFERDANGRVVRQQDANGNQLAYTYDARGQLTRIDNPTSGATTFTYDPAERLTQVTGREGTYGYTYDAFGRVVGHNTPDLTATYTYDTVGNVTERNLGDYGLYTYTYDALDRPVRVTKDGDGIDLTYNDQGWLTAIARDNGSRTVYDYDNNGRITQILHLSAAGAPADLYTYTYDAVGNVSRVQRVLGTELWTVIYSYDANHQLIGERWLDPENQTIYALSIRYDDAGNRVEQTTRRSFDTPERVIYAYNSQNQLVSATRNPVTAEEEQILSLPGAITLSAVGLPLLLFLMWRRRWGRVVWIPGVLLLVLPLAVAAQGVVEPEVTTYAYDPNGSVISITHPDGGSLLFTYDAHNRVRTVRGTNAAGEPVSVEVEYNVFGRVRTVTTPDTRYELAYEGNRLVGMVERTTNRRVSYFTPLDDDVMRIDGPDGPRWLITDAFENTRQFMDGNGAVVSDTLRGFSYNAFGEFIAPYGEDAVYRFDETGRLATQAEGVGLSPQSPDPLPLYRGELYESASDLYMMGVRVFEPGIGRFLQRDPLRHDPQGTLYTYVYNRPNAFTDPTGLTPEPAIRNLNAIQVPSQILPDTQPRPILPAFPTLTAVDALQEQESHRPLAILGETAYGVNDVSAALAPSLCAFHIRRLNPVDAPTRAQLAAPYRAIIAEYSPQSGWEPNIAPGLSAQASPQAAVLAAQATLETTRTAGRIWQNQPCAAYVSLPPLPAVSATRHVAPYTALPHVFQEISLYPSLAGFIDTLTDADAVTGPALPLPSLVTGTIAPEIEVVRPGGFQSLFEQTQAFYETTTMRDQPLPDPLRWRENLRAIDIVPPVQREIR